MFYFTCNHGLICVTFKSYIDSVLI